MLRSKTEDYVKGRQAGLTHIYQLKVVSYRCMGHLVRQVVIARSLTILHSTSMKHKSSPHRMQAAIRFPVQVASLGQGVLTDGVSRAVGNNLCIPHLPFTQLSVYCIKHLLTLGGIVADGRVKCEDGLWTVVG